MRISAITYLSNRTVLIEDSRENTVRRFLFQTKKLMAKPARSGDSPRLRLVAHRSGTSRAVL